MDLSVVICTRNPRPDYLARTLAALRRQTLPLAAWELLLVDNASSPPVLGMVDLSWHPRGRVIAEAEVGLTPARLRGMREAAGRILICVDDDNLLLPDYLAEALAVAQRFPSLGAWGGQSIPEYEMEPAAGLADFLPSLALRQFDQARWSHDDSSWDFLPFGAGMCVRVEVAALYAREFEINPARRKIGRSGQNVVGGEDLDLALTSFRLRLGIGIFPQLKLIHLIPRRRVEPHYLYRIALGGSYGARLVRLLHAPQPVHLRRGRLRRWARTSPIALHLLHRLGRLERSPAYHHAVNLGTVRAEDDYLRLQAGREPRGVERL